MNVAPQSRHCATGPLVHPLPSELPLKRISHKPLFALGGILDTTHLSFSSFSSSVHPSHVFLKFVLLILNKTSQPVLFVQRSFETRQTSSSLLSQDPPCRPALSTSKQSTWDQPGSFSFAQLYILVGTQTYSSSPKQLFL